MATVIEITSGNDRDFDKIAGFQLLLPNHYFIWQLPVVALLRVYGQSAVWATLIPWFFRPPPLSITPPMLHTHLCHNTYLLTHSTVQSPSWAANWFAASQEIPRISRNPKVHYRTHKRPPNVSILDRPNPVQKPTSHLLKIHPNIIHPSTPRSPH